MTGGGGLGKLEGIIIFGGIPVGGHFFLGIAVGGYRLFFSQKINTLKLSDTLYRYT